MGLVIIIKTSSDLPQKSSISSEIFSNLREFSETVWKHFRLYFRNSLVIFGNFQKMFGSISCLESLGRFWRIVGNPQKAVRNLHKIINNVIIRQVHIIINYTWLLIGMSLLFIFISWVSALQCHHVHVQVISSCTVCYIKYVLYLQWYPTCTVYQAMYSVPCKGWFSLAHKHKHKQVRTPAT